MAAEHTYRVVVSEDGLAVQRVSVEGILTLASEGWDEWVESAEGGWPLSLVESWLRNVGWKCPGGLDAQLRIHVEEYDEIEDRYTIPASLSLTATVIRA